MEERINFYCRNSGEIGQNERYSCDLMVSCGHIRLTEMIIGDDVGYDVC